MSGNGAIVELNIQSLTDEQVIAWYSHHWNSTVRALVARLAANEERYRRNIIEAYEDAFRLANEQASARVNPHGLSASEQRIAMSEGDD